MKPSVAIRIAAALACLVLGIQPGAVAADRQTVPIIPAPALTPAQIDRLKHVTSWDLVYSGTEEESASGAGVVPFTDPPVPWSHDEHRSLAYQVKAHIAGKNGPSDCRLGTTGNPCVVKYTPGGRVDEGADDFHRLDTVSGPCSPTDPTVFTTTSSVDFDAPAGSYILDGSPGRTGSGDIEIDYSVNPPILYGNLAVDGSTRHAVLSAEGCTASSYHEQDESVLLSVGWWPPSNGCCADGDSQVRIEHGAFVVRGISNEIRTGIRCVVPGSMQCADPNGGYYYPFTDEQHYEWVLREHDCQDTNGNGNSDDDDDGLCDNWETNGLDVDGDGVVDLPLNKPPYNADPEHKDLFVEIDYMDDPANSHTEKPSNAALIMVRNAFAAAPVTNPDGLKGIRLHFVGSDAAHPNASKLVDEALPHSDRISFPEYIPAACAATSFDDVKAAHFGTAAERADPDANNILEAKARVFRYAVFAHQQADNDDGNGGCADNGSSGVAELPGNDLIVTVGGPDFRPYGNPGMVTGGSPSDCFRGETGEACAERHVDAATFMHEFGHTLGLQHGGIDGTNCKPNYLSVMNYSFQFPDLVPSRPLDYSGGVANGSADDPFAPLDEGNLSEPDGIAGPVGRNSVFGLDGRDAYILLNHPIDWNGDPNGRTDETGVKADIARMDAIDACSRGQSVDVQNLTLKPSAGVDPASVPAPDVFTVHVNGTTMETPAAVAIASGRVYLRLPSPAGMGDTFTLDYAMPQVNPLLDAADVPYGPFTGVPITNVTGQLKTLFARDDWATLQYDMRLAPDFADGTPRDSLPEPEVSLREVTASAAEVDFDGDGVSNAEDNCPATYNPGQEDLDGDGYGDDCEPESDADEVDPVSTALATPPPNASGWATQEVTVDLSAADDPNGSGVREIDYVLSGAQSEPEQDVAGDSVPVVVSGEGETTIKYYAVDNAGNAEPPHTQTVRVDATPPAMRCSVKPRVLRPPEHKMRRVTATVDVEDAGSGPGGFVLTSVTSSEPDSAGRRDRPNDIQGFTVGEASTSGRLRAERWQGGPGRVYTFVWTGRDLAGNAATCTATVTVPR